MPSSHTASSTSPWRADPITMAARWITRACAVVISHDRWVLDRIATHVLAFEGDSQVRWFEGNFTEYEEYRHRELGTAADQPHRIRYKKLAG